MQVIKDTGADRIELYTENYADYPSSPDILNRYVDMANQVSKLGLLINAGHDLSLDNLGALLQAIPIIEEVSIGHALICDALLLGLKETMHRYLELCKNSRST